MIIVNGFQPLTIITKCSILDVAAVLDPPLFQKMISNKKRCSINTLNLAFGRPWKVDFYCGTTANYFSGTAMLHLKQLVC